MMPEGPVAGVDPGTAQHAPAFRGSEGRYRSLFQNSPISLWEEDFSQVKGYLDALRAEGVTDLGAYFEEHPQAVARCANLVKIMGANQATIRLFGAESEEALLSGLSRVFTRQSLVAFREELLALFEGSTTWEGEVPQRTLAGEEIYVTLHLAVAPGYEDTWARVFVSLVDITERKRAEKALRESEERFRSIFENAVMGLYRTTPDGRILMANPALVRLLGFSSFEELAERSLEQEGYAAGYPRSVFQELIEREGQVSGFETAWLRSDGNTVYLRESARVMRAEDGSTLYYEGTIEDITEQKLAEKRLQENEKRYRALFERTNDAVFILDLDGVHLMVNRQAAHLLGYAEEEMVGMSVRQVVAPHELENSRSKLAALRAGESLPVYERIFRRKDGSEIPVEINVALVYDAAGQPLHIQSVVRDITARKRAEAERERLLVDLMHRSTQLLTAAEVSKSASTILEPEELMSQTVDLIQQRFGFYYVGLFLMDEAGRYAVLRAGTGQAGRRMLDDGHKLAVGGESMIGQCVAHSEALVALDVGEEAVRFDNPLLPETRSEMALPLTSRGRCIGALTVQSATEAAFSADDVATLQAMADQLGIAITNAWLYDEVQRYATGLEVLVEERTAELAAVNRELEAFAYSVSHDLRAPLRSIDGFSQALLEDYPDRLDATGKDYLRRVRAASQRMGHLIDGLLKLSRLTRCELSWQAVELSTLAERIAAELQEMQPERQVEFVLAQGIVAQGDGHLLRVVLQNLLDNAWKFTSRQEHARIEFGVIRSEGQEVYFVRDNGAGLDMAYGDKLFGPFQRLHSVTEFEGSGIGLATVQRIIHRHGGQVWAEGAVGEGATFYFSLGTKEGRADEG